MVDIQDKQEISDGIDFPGNVDDYLFTGNEGDLITIFVDNLTDAGTKQLRLRLFAPNGTDILDVDESEPPGFFDNDDVEIRDFTLPESGTYTLLLDGIGDAQGNYSIGLTNFNQNLQAIEDNQGIDTSLEFAGDGEAYTFTGTEGDLITAFVDNLADAGTKQLRLQLLDRDGITVLDFDKSDLPGFFDNDDVAIRDFTLPDSGTYTLLLDSIGDARGNYSIGLTNFNQNSQTIENGQSVETSLEFAGDGEAYIFNGNTGDSITAFVDNLADAGTKQLRLRLLGPDGINELISDESEPPGFFDNDDVEIRDFALPESGTYTLLIDGIGDARGSYTLGFSQIPGPIIPPPINQNPVVINPIPEQFVDEDSVFNFQFGADTFTDPDPSDTLDYTAALVNGSLPSWLQFDADTRTFSGTPTNDDVTTLTVEVTADDGKGGTVSDTFDLTGNNTNDAPTLENLILDQTAQVDEAFEFTVPENTFQDVDAAVDPDHTLTYSASLEGGNDLPTWLSFDPTTRQFSATPSIDNIGTLNIQVTVTDNADEFALDIFELTVQDDNNPTPDPPIDDVLQGTFNDDFLDGKAGNDLIFGQWGDDLLQGGSGDDILFGNWDNDFLQGNDGNDELRGDWGDDFLLGGAGHDILVGSWGDDRLDGGLGDDELHGGRGSDRFVLRPGEGIDQILDYQDGLDQILLPEPLRFGQLDITQVQDDTLITITATGEQLATLTNIATTAITEADFAMI